MCRVILATVTVLLVAAVVAPATADDTAAALACDWYACAHGEADDAVAVCTRLLAFDPGKSDAAHMHRGLHYYRKHDLDLALLDFD